MSPGFSFDQLYVISDLHLGGAPGHQIFGSTRELKWLIVELAKQDPTLRLALVINGDFVDFLAEPEARHFDPHHAVDKLDRIATQDPAFEPVFAALRQFLRTPNRHLIINLGNHDIELALPWVRRRLLSLLLDARPPQPAGDARRLHLVTDGTGVLCEVGGRSVLCVHGNEVDRWNPVDFERLREIARDLQLGRPVVPWIPNAGSRMVVDLMNDVKQTYPFVDLLKPETGAVGRVLAACAGGSLLSLERVSDAGVTFGSRFAASLSKPRGMLGADDNPAGAPGASVPRQALPVAPDRKAAAAELLARIEIANANGVDPLTLVEGREGETLGDLGAVWGWIKGDTDAEVLREALDGLDRDPSFVLHDYDDTARLLDETITREVDFLVAGHTHLQRARRRMFGRGVYFNSGTWARLLCITPAVRQDPVAFAQLFALLKQGSVDALEKIPGGAVFRHNTVVEIKAVAAGASGRLLNIVADGDLDELAVKASEFTLGAES